MKKTYKKLSITLLCVAIAANAHAKRDKENKIYTPETADVAPLVPVVPVAEDLGAGIEGLFTGNRKGDVSGFAAAPMDAVPFAAEKRAEDSNKKSKSETRKEKRAKRKKRYADSE